MKSSIQQPTPPAQPSVQDSAKAYAESLPTIYNAQLEYQPKFEQQNLQLTQQYAPQYKAIQDALYPELAELDKSLTEMAKTGMNADLPDYLKQGYLDQFRAEVGENNASGIGADYVSRRMMAAGEDYRNNFRNLGLTLTGRQPLYQSTSFQPAYNATQNFNYGTTSGFQANTYGNYAGAYSSMYAANGQYKSNLNQLYQGYAKMAFQGAGAMMGKPF